MNASQRKKAHTQIQNANYDADKEGSNNGELHGGGAPFVIHPARRLKIAHGQFNRISVVFVIFVSSMLATVTPGNNGA